MRENHLPLYPSYVMKHNKRLFSAALRQCESWKKAMHAEGIEVPKPPYVSRVAVLRALREFLNGHSIEDIPHALRVAADYYLR